MKFSQLSAKITLAIVFGITSLVQSQNIYNKGWIDFNKNGAFDLDEIVSDFDPRYSNADISAVATGAINFAIGRKLSDLKQLGKLQDINTLSEDDLRIQLCNGDFKEATKTVFPSVTNEKQYQLGI